MAKEKLTSDEFIKHFNEKSKGKIKLVSEYINKRTPVLVECTTCGYRYEVSVDTFLYRKSNKIKDCYNCNNPMVVCEFCGSTFRKRKKELNKTKRSYCSINCRNRAMNDAKRKSTINNYRNVADANYKHKCSVCGWDEDEDILEVHHIDENRENNNVDNLIILCPTCHRKLTSHKYKLVDRTIIVKK